jgi:hypothetical protein
MLDSLEDLRYLLRMEATKTPQTVRTQYVPPASKGHKGKFVATWTGDERSYSAYQVILMSETRNHEYVAKELYEEIGYYGSVVGTKNPDGTWSWAQG